MRRKLFFLGSLLLLFTIVNAAIFFFTRSGTSKTDTEVLQTMEQSIKESGIIIQSATDKIIYDFEEMAMDPPSAVKANYWKPKAEIISSFTRIMCDYIDAKKNKKTIDNNDITDINKYLLDHKRDILARDTLIKNSFNDHFTFINKIIFILCNDSIRAKKYLKENISQNSIRLLLSSVQNNLKKIENEIVVFCKLQVGRIRKEYPATSAIIAQNSMHLKPGSILEIYAGVGLFSRKQLPEIFVNNKKIAQTHEPISVYRMKMPKKPGIYSVPIKISYFDQDGMWLTIEKDVKYTVAKECDQ